MIKLKTVVGLTGQTGAGKSTVSKVFAENGFHIINADHTARKVMEKGSRCLAEVVNAFGTDILNNDGTLDRKAFAFIVFNDKSMLDKLNSITYPHITAEISEVIENTDGFILLDAPTLFESGADKLCDIIVSVTADPEIREKRIVKRDNLTHEQAVSRMKSQLDEDFFVSHSDFIIKNNGSVEAAYGISKEIADKIKLYNKF